MEDEDDLAPNPPHAADVARRAAIIKHQVVYVMSMPPPQIVAEISRTWTQDERAQFDNDLEKGRHRVIDGLRSCGLWKHTSPSERQIFEQPVRDLTEQQRIDTSWHAEAVHCLVWALDLFDEIPGYDIQTDPDIILPLISTSEVTEFCRSTTLRERAEIDEAREIAQLWHWRSRTRELQQQGYKPRKGQPSLDTIVREVALRMAASGMLPGTIDEDFPVLGRAYRDLSEADWVMVRSIAIERHFALNWLCGYAPGNKWDETPTDT